MSANLSKDFLFLRLRKKNGCFLKNLSSTATPS